MDLSRLPDVGPVHARLLQEAGVSTVAELAALSDLDALAARTRLERALLESFQAAARSRVETLLERAGVRGVEQLAAADLDELERGTGIPRAHLETFQRAARAKTSPLPDRVILADGRASARVSLGGVVRSGLAIVTLRLNEDETSVLDRVPGDAVVLKERAVTAPARVDGVVHRDLPIYKETPSPEGGPAKEARVRVAGIRNERPAPAPVPSAPPAAPTESAEPPAAKKGFRLFRRGG